MSCSHNNDDCNCGEAVFNRLPTIVTELRCQCPDPKWVSFWNVGIKSIGYYCLHCGKPHRNALVNHYFKCEQCESYYTLDYRQLDLAVEDNLNRPQGSPLWLAWPPRYYLCGRCDPDVKAALLRHSASGVRFS
jgi:hypothetical protein